MSAQAGTGQVITIAGRTFRRPALETSRVNWMLIGLYVLLGFYWLFVSALERIDGTLILARWFFPDLAPTQISTLSFPWILRFAVEMFHPRVLRHVIPVIVGWWLAVEAATSLVQVLYDCPDRSTARDFLKRQRRRGRPPSGEAYAVTPQTLHRMEDESVLLRVGGPVAIAVPSGHAAVTEWNSRFSRVVGSGTRNLNHFEHIHSVISLHPQDRTASSIQLMTKEGINVTTDAHIIFRIDPGEEPPTRARPFPYDPEAVRKAAYSATVLPNGNESSWDNAPMGKVRGTLAGVVGQYGLDELIFPESSAREPHHTIRTEVERKVRADLKRAGIQFVRLQLGRFEPPSEVSEQYTEYWLANWQKQNQIARASGAANTLQEVEVAYAEAEITMLQAIVEGVRRAQGESDDASGYMLALRLVETLEKMVKQSQKRLQPNNKAMTQVMPKLNQLQEQLTRLESLASGSQKAAPAPPQDRLNPPRKLE